MKLMNILRSKYDDSSNNSLDIGLETLRAKYDKKKQIKIQKYKKHKKLISVYEILDQKMLEYPEYADSIKSLKEVWSDFSKTSTCWAKTVFTMIRNNETNVEMKDTREKNDYMNMRDYGRCLVAESHGWSDDYRRNQICGECNTFSILFNHAFLYKPNTSEKRYIHRKRNDFNTLRIVPPMTELIPAYVEHHRLHRR